MTSTLKLTNYNTNVFYPMRTNDVDTEIKMVPIRSMLAFLKCIRYDIGIYNNLYNKSTMTQVISEWEKTGIAYDNEVDLTIHLQNKIKFQNISFENVENIRFIPRFLSKLSNSTNETDVFNVDKCKQYIQQIFHEESDKMLSVDEITAYTLDKTKFYEYSNDTIEYVFINKQNNTLCILSKPQFCCFCHHICIGLH